MRPAIDQTAKIAKITKIASVLSSLWTVCVLTDPAAAQSTSALCPSQLGPTIDAITQQPAVRNSQWGILIQPQNTATDLYSRNADQFFLPASTTKLFTTAAALTRLTPKFQRQTPLFASGKAPALDTLRIVGQGDPTLNDAKLVQIAKTLRAKGIQSIDTLIGDDSLFQGSPIVASWSWEDLHGGDGLPSNSLILNHNALPIQFTPQALGQPLRVQWLGTVPPNGLKIVNRSKTVPTSAPELTAAYPEDDHWVAMGQLHVGSASDTIEVPVPNPGAAFVERFRTILNGQQIRVNQVSLVTEPAVHSQASPIASIPFPPLSALLNETNQYSNNLYAEVLLKLLGQSGPSIPQTTALEQGLNERQKTLTQLGVESKGYQLVDGSGLSRQNLSTPRALVQTLNAIARSPYASVFRNSLAIAGQSGTLKNRFQSTLLQGKLYGKTGSLKGVTALSGYLQGTAYSPLIFSILVNDSTQSNAVLRQSIDQIVFAMAQLKPCTNQ